MKQKTNSALGFSIGQKVTYAKRYDRKACNRFVIPVDGCGAAKDPVPMDGSGIGFVVGVRSVIMSDYRYCSGSQIGDMDWEPSWSEGKRENVLLVTDDIAQEPFIVRVQDAKPD